MPIAIISEAAKTSTVVVRLIPEERHALIALARSERRTMSEVVRGLLRNEAARRGLWPGGRLADPER